MKARYHFLTTMLTLAISLTAAAQSPAASSATQNAPDGSQRGGGRGFGGGGMGRGLMGTVTEVAADHYTIKTETGETYTIHYSANTRIMKQSARPAGQKPAGANADQAGRTRGEGRGPGEGGGTPPQPIKSTDIKVGDAVVAMGEVDAAAKSVGAVAVMQVDPERAKQMRDMQANFGKTWIMGKVTAIDGVKVTLTGSVDNAPHSFMADENTTFRKRRDPITLADIQVGDMIRADGSVKDGAFLASTVSAMGAPPAGGGGPRNGQPGSNQPAAPPR